MISIESSDQSIKNSHLEALESCLCLNIKKCARTLTNLYDKALKGTNINSGQFSILLSIQTLGAPTLNQIALDLNLKSSTVSRALSRLERDGFITIQKGVDKRMRKARLSAEGERTISQAYPLWKEAQKDLLKLFAFGNSSEFMGHLNALSKASY